MPGKAGASHNRRSQLRKKQALPGQPPREGFLIEAPSQHIDEMPDAPLWRERRSFDERIYEIGN